MPIAINGSASSSLKGTGTTTTFSHTIASGLEQSILVVCYQSAVVQSTGVTWNGTAMTLGKQYTVSNYYTSYYYLINPTPGTFNIVVSHASNATNRAVMGAMTFTGVNQVNPIAVDSFIEANTSSPSSTVNCGKNGCMLIGSLMNGKSGTNPTVTWSGGQTELYNLLSTNNDDRGSAAYLLVTTSGNNTFSATLSASINNSLQVIALMPTGLTYGEYLGAGSAITKGLWHLNGNSVDSSGNNNNGTDTNITYVPGRFGQCARGTIAGTSGISIAYSAPLVPGTGAFSRSFWIKTTITTLGYIYYSQENSSTHNQVDGAYMDTNGKVVTQFRGVENTIAQITSNKSINDGVWHKITVGSSGSGGTQYIYIDGDLDVSGAVGSTNINLQSPTPYTLLAVNQAWGPGRGAYLQCDADEIVFENRMPSASEIKKDYAYSLGRYATL
jgi:hypothetical protein